MAISMRACSRALRMTTTLAGSVPAFEVRLDEFVAATFSTKMSPSLTTRRACGATGPWRIGHRLDRSLAIDQRPEHRAVGHAEEVAGDARQLDVGGL